MNNMCSSTNFCVLLAVLMYGHAQNSEEINGNSLNDTIAYNVTDNVIEETSSEENNSTSEERTEGNDFLAMRERYRKFRLRRIRQHILSSLGWTDTPVIPEELRLHYMAGRIEGPIFTDERQSYCFSATCELPRQVDTNLWTDPELGGFRVYTSIPNRHLVSETSLHTAELNVYFTHVEGFTCHGEEVPISQTGSRYLVSIYQFIRPLRIHRGRNRILNRKRLVDAQMVTTSGHMWVKFNVKQAVLEWVRGGRNNFGFEITVRDENETDCNALGMFVPVDCNSEDGTSCPDNLSGPLHMSPWAQEHIEHNHPYLEISTRNQVRHIRRRLRRSTSSRSRSVGRERGNGDETRSWTRHGTCQGRKEPVNLVEMNDRIIAPRVIRTLRCSGTCATVSDDLLQIGASRCRATDTRPVYALYFDDTEESNIVLGRVFDEVVQCGC